MSAHFIETGEGVRVAARDDLASMSGYILLEQEDWFESEIRFVRSYFQPGMHALDVGANHGVYSLAMARRLQGRGQIWAFEPCSEPYALLADSVRANGFEALIRPLKIGLTDRARTARMHLSENSELNSLHGQSMRCEPVRLENLDDLLPTLARDVSIDFVKLEAEGEELAIVHGAPMFFSRQSPLVMFEIRHGTQFNHGLSDAFVRMGYRLYRHLPGLDVLVPASSDKLFDTFQLNLFAVKPDREAQLVARGLLCPQGEPEPDGKPSGDWRPALMAMPFSRTLHAGWESRALARSPLMRQHTQALSAYLAANHRAQDAAARVACLRGAVRTWQFLARRAPSALSIQLCLARALADLGQRADALQTLEALWRELGSAAPDAFALPFLPPIASFEGQAPSAGLHDWLLAALVEAYETWRTYSSFYAMDSSRLLHAHLSNPNLSRAMRRRFVLHAARGGARVCLSEHDALLRPASDHHNLTFWERFVETGPAPAAARPPGAQAEGIPAWQ